MKKLLFALAILAGTLGYLANPAAATPTNTSITSWFNGCRIEAIYGNFGSSAYATFRVLDMQYSDGRCALNAEAVYYTSGGVSYRSIRSWNTTIPYDFYLDYQIPTGWQQVDHVGSVWGAEFCLTGWQHYNANYPIKQYRWDMRWNDGSGAGSAVLEGYGDPCAFTAP